MSKRIQNRASAPIPTATSVLPGRKTETDMSSISIDQGKTLSVMSLVRTAVQISQDVITGSNTSENIIHNPSNNPINITSPSEPDPASHWVESDFYRKTVPFDGSRISSGAYSELVKVQTCSNAPNIQLGILGGPSRLLTIFDVAHDPNEPNAVNGNHWRRGTAVSRHMDSSRSNYRISQVMASARMSKRASLSHGAPRAYC